MKKTNILNFERLKNSLSKIKTELIKHKVKSLYVFGSVARNEATKNSDVDLIVEFTDSITLFELAGLKLFLEEKLGVKVDLVTRDAIREEFKKQINMEAKLAA